MDDFAMAFDSVTHWFLLANLKSSGITGLVQNWIKSFHVQSIMSSPNLPRLTGTLQGSVIVPLLFFCNIWMICLWICFSFSKWMVLTRSLSSRRLLSPSSDVTGAGHETYQSTALSIHASLLGTSLPFLRLFHRQTPKPRHRELTLINLRAPNVLQHS